MASHNDTAGQLLNSLSTGVSITDAVSELLDNSISAGSSKIHLKLSESTLIISDNGCGMDRDKLEDSSWLNRRTSPSSQRHGRYGFGKKQAEITLTNLEGSATTFSSAGKISEITTNYPKILQTGIYAPQACGLQCDSRDIWHENAIDPSGNGTICYICLSEDVRRKISELCSDHTVTGLQFTLATTYCEALTNGLSITIQYGENAIRQVYPFDRLCSSKRDTTPTFHYKTYEIDILQKKGELASYYIKTENGGCQQFDRSKKKWIVVDAPASFDSDMSSGSGRGRGRVTYEMAYSTDWNHLQQDELKKNDIAPLSDGQNGVEAQRNKTDGKELVRNGKVINHSGYKYKNVQNALKKIHRKTRERISFKANECMDDGVFKVQVNKSSVNEGEIDEYLWKSFEQLKESFVRSIHSESSSDVVEVQTLSAISQPQPPLSENTLPSNIKPKHTLATRVRARVISDSDSESETGMEVAARCSGVARTVAAAGGGYAVGRKTAGTAAPKEMSPKEMPIFAPDSECAVGSSNHHFILRRTGENILAEWKRSGKYMASFNETLDKMHIEFSGNLAADTLKRYLNRIPLDEKYDLLLEMIREKYASPETRMKGIELQRTYNKTFEADIAAGIAAGM